MPASDVPVTDVPVSGAPASDSSTPAASTPAAPTPAPTPAAPKKRRGLETAADMIRSLSIVMILVVMMWFFGQAPKSDEVRIRVLDPGSLSATLDAFHRIAPAAPLPTGLSAGWRATSAEYTPPGQLRVGYVTPAEEHAGYAASTGPAAAFVDDITGKAPVVGTVEVNGQTWQRHLGEKDAISLSRTEGAVTLIVGTRFASASLDEVVELAGSLKTRPSQTG